MKRRGFEYLLFVCWVLLCGYTFYQAQYPGFEDHARWKYPLAGAVAVSAGLGGLIAALYGVTRIAPGSLRVVANIGYVILLLGLICTLSITDQRGHFYVPGQFAAIALVGLIAWWAVGWFKRRGLAA